MENRIDETRSLLNPHCIYARLERLAARIGSCRTSEAEDDHNPVSEEVVNAALEMGMIFLLCKCYDRVWSFPGRDQDLNTSQTPTEDCVERAWNAFERAQQKHSPKITPKAAHEWLKNQSEEADNIPPSPGSFEDYIRRARRRRKILKR